MSIISELVDDVGKLTDIKYLIDKVKFNNLKEIDDCNKLLQKKSEELFEELCDNEWNKLKERYPISDEKINHINELQQGDKIWVIYEQLQKQKKLFGCYQVMTTDGVNKHIYQTKNAMSMNLEDFSTDLRLLKIEYLSYYYMYWCDIGFNEEKGFYCPHSDTKITIYRFKDK